MVLVLLAAAAIAVVGRAAVSGWTNHAPDPQRRMFPGVSGFLLWLLIAQLALFLVFGLVVAVLARRAPAPGDGFEPYLGGRLAVLIALLAFLLGGLLSAAVNLGVAGLLGTAVPGRLVLPPAPDNSLYVPPAGICIRGGRPRCAGRCPGGGTYPLSPVPQELEALQWPHRQ